MILDWYEKQDRAVRWLFAAILSPVVCVAAVAVVWALALLMSLPYAWNVLGYSVVVVCVVATVHQVLEDW